MTNRVWLFSRKLDLIVLFAPVWLCWIIAFALPEHYLYSDIPIWVWVSVVIGIDVSHVWSSIFRTYVDPEEFNSHRSLLILAPIVSFLAAFGIAYFSSELFWRCLAYVAVFHFIKQQFGFMRIYKARSRDHRKKKLGDNFVIYVSMLYPILYWHLQPDLNFAWFVCGDFLQIPIDLSQTSFMIMNGLYFLLLGYWLIEEIRFPSENLPIGKILWILTTAGNWFLGIVYFDSDIVFTITNVVAHGVPYLALIVFYKIGKDSLLKKKKRVFRTVTVIILTVLVLAIFEEYLWDTLVYRENEEFFTTFIPYIKSVPSKFWQIMAIGLLAVPQITHYILDGFIWKNNAKNPYLKDILIK